MDSTTKSAPWVLEWRIMNQPNTALATARTSSDQSPRLLSSSRKPTASAGKPGVAFGNTTDAKKVKTAYIPASAMPGMNAPSYMSPTDLPSWSAITMSTSDGGMICASVPDAAMTPAAKRRS